MTKTIAKQFGCSEAQLRAQYRRNSQQLGRMAEQAELTGEKVNGYTAAQLRNLQAQAAQKGLLDQ